MDFASYIERPWQNLGYVSLFSLGIAIVITVITGGSFAGNLIVSMCIGCSISLSYILLGKLMLRFFSPYIAPIPLTGIGLAVGMLLGGTLALNRPLFFFTEDYGTFLIGVFFGVLGFVVFGTRARLQETAAELAAERLRAAEQAKVLAETELKLLQAQIEPHFLFNTLGNVASLIKRDPDAAEQMLLHLTTLLRSSLSRTRQGGTTFGQELAIAKAYLEIHAIRMQQRLRYSIDVDPSLDNIPLPPLLVQPLIENAVKHGIDPLEAGGEIVLTAELTHDEANQQLLKITVRDTGQGISAASAAPSNSSGTGTGLKNIRNRLRSLYGSTAELIIQDSQDQPGVEAALVVPLTIPQAQPPSPSGAQCP